MSTSSSDSIYTDSYTNGNSNIGALFASPLDIISWNNFGTYVADLSLNEDPTARANAEIFTLTVDENLVVNGNTTINGTLNSISSTELQTLDGIERNIQDTINTFQDTIDSLEEQSLRIQNQNIFTVNGQNATFNSGISIIGINTQDDYITSGQLGIAQEPPKPIIITAGDGIDISDNGTISISEPFTISNGNVGIGTDSPSEKLVVNGDTTLNGIIGMPNNVKIESKEYFGNSVTTPSYAWDFRNNTGTSDVPDIINGQNAILYGGAYSTSEGMVFDGTDDYIKLDSWETGGEAFSVEAYVKYDSFNNWSRIFDFGDGDGNNVTVEDPSGGQNNIILTNQSSSTVLEFQIHKDDDIVIGGAMGDFDNGIWQHIVATVDESNIARVYINGTLDSSANGTATNAVLTRTNHYIGKSGWSNDGYFDGTIAYFRWWNGHELSEDEVTTLYDNRENITDERLNFNIDNETVLSISKTYVGIGTTSPSELLTIQSASATDATFSVITQEESDNAIIYLGTPHNSGRAIKCAIIAEGRSNWSTSNLHFCLNNDTGDWEYNDSSYSATLSDSRMVITPDGYVGIGATDPAYELDVSGDINFTGDIKKNGIMWGVPTGGIIMWSGSTIPEGWAICNGENSTPDLRGRFILGGEDNIGDTGGNDNITLSIDNLPSHNHTGSVDSAGAHTHVFNTRNDDYNDVGGDNAPSFGRNDSNNYKSWNSLIDSAGAHIHTFTTENTGSGNSIDIRPTYYVLAYIMKL